MKMKQTGESNSIIQKTQQTDNSFQQFAALNIRKYFSKRSKVHLLHQLNLSTLHATEL